MSPSGIPIPGLSAMRERAYRKVRSDLERVAEIDELWHVNIKEVDNIEVWHSTQGAYTRSRAQYVSGPQHGAMSLEHIRTYERSPLHAGYRSAEVLGVVAGVLGVFDFSPTLPHISFEYTVGIVVGAVACSIVTRMDPVHLGWRKHKEAYLSGNQQEG